MSLFVIVDWWSTIRVYFFSSSHWRWLYRNIVLLTNNFIWSCICCSWLICVKCVLFLFYLLFFCFLSFFFNFLLLLQSSSVLSLLFLSELFLVILVFRKWIWVSILKCCFFTNILCIFLSWYLSWWVWSLKHTKIFILMKLLL